MRLILGDCFKELQRLEDGSIDALICDPPAGIDFMGKEWDRDKGGRDNWIAWLTGVMGAALHAMKPGAYGLVWALPRTSHWTATALEDAGFEIRDVIMHVFGSGFPKSLNLPVAIDKHLGAMGPRGAAFSVAGDVSHLQSMEGKAGEFGEHDGITTDAQRWHGWGTALKPAAEHWILIRKPLCGTVASNVLEHGTGGLNIEGCRVGTEPMKMTRSDGTMKSGNVAMACHNTGRVDAGFASGRWPPHLLLTHSAECGEQCVADCPVRIMDEQSGESTTPTSLPQPAFNSPTGLTYGFKTGHGRTGERVACAGDSGGASRFFPRFRYQPKPSRAEREAGCGYLPGKSAAEVTEHDEGAAGQKHARSGKTMTGEIHNHHPTLKSLDLMRWLVRLITPPGGTVLDPFMGSGTTGCACACEGMDFVGIEQDPEYIQIARARIEYYSAARHEVENDDSPRPEQKGQATLW